VIKFRVWQIAYVILALGIRIEAAELLDNGSVYWQLCLQGLWRLFPKVYFSVLALHSQHPELDITWVALSRVAYVTLGDFIQS